MSIKNKIHVVLVGFGFSGRTFHAPFLSTLEDYNLNYVVSSNTEKVHTILPTVQVEPDFNKVIHNPNIELVVLATPNATHYELAKAALESGKHVVVDKPFTLNWNEAQDLIEIAKHHQRILTVYHNRRWDGDFLTIKKLLAEETLGDIYLYEAHFHRYRPVPNLQRWKENQSLGAGILYDLGSHLLDQTLILFGLPDAVDADVLAQRPGAAVADDYFHLTLKYGPKRVLLKASNLVHTAGPRYQLHGIKGSFLKYGIDPQEQDLLVGKSPLDKDWGQDKEENYGILSLNENHIRVSTIPGSYNSFYKLLAQSIYENSSPPVLPEEAAQVIKLIETCRRDMPKE